jgi:hypothetical protein
MQTAIFVPDRIVLCSFLSQPLSVLECLEYEGLQKCINLHQRRATQ